jgi:hypothetical protein
MFVISIRIILFPHFGRPIFIKHVINGMIMEILYSFSKLKLNSVALVRKRTIPTERPPHVVEVSANFCG